MNKLPLRMSVGLLLSACLLVLGVAGVQEKEAAEVEVELKSLPAAVQKTVAEQSRGASVRGLTKELDEAGKTVYELELMVNGHTKDVMIDDKGTVLEVEEAVTLASLPAAVKAAVTKNAGKSKILLIESVTKSNQLSAYEVHMQTGKKGFEFQVDQQGKLVPNSMKEELADEEENEKSKKGAPAKKTGVRLQGSGNCTIGKA